MFAQPPGVAGEEARADGVSLETGIVQDGVEPEGKMQGGEVVVEVERVCAEEPSVIDALGPPASFEGDEAVAPLGRDGVVVVPGKPARPGLEADGCADRAVLPEGEIDAEVGGGGAVVEQVGPQGHSLPNGGGAHVAGNSRRIYLGA